MLRHNILYTYEIKVGRCLRYHWYVISEKNIVYEIYFKTKYSL